MMRCLALIVLVSLHPAVAQELPALYSVTGVAADDVLNIRQAPDPSSPILGTLAPDASGVEVIALADGWATVNADEQTGYAAARFLEPETGTPWYRLDAPISCFGTEPFWSFIIDAPNGTSTFTTPDSPDPRILPLSGMWPGESWTPSAAISIADGMAVLHRERCGDGMSERGYGIKVDIFLNTGAGHRIAGCCSLSVPADQN